MRKNLLTNAAATVTGDADFTTDRRAERTYQATVSGTGSVTATVIIEASNEDPTLAAQSFLTLGTITLSGTTSATDGFASVGAWAYVRARLTAISGTGATVLVTMGA